MASTLEAWQQPSALCVHTATERGSSELLLDACATIFIQMIVDAKRHGRLQLSVCSLVLALHTRVMSEARCSGQKPISAAVVASHICAPPASCKVGQGNNDALLGLVAC